MPNWESAYRQYVRQVRSGATDTPVPEVGDTDLWDREPFDDVYHAALSMLYSNQHGGVRWIPSPDSSLFFRGQDREWPVIPKLYRDQPSRDAIDNERERVGRFVRSLQAAMPNVTDEHGVAIAQHYSAEANVKTWLVDVTWNPFVALFFASSKGEAGQVGVVWSHKKKEWDNLSVGGTNRLGPLRDIEPPGIRRIEAQSARFIDSAHPDLFEQYVADTIRFKQQPGMVFEDDESTPPISRAALFPPDDPLLEIIKNPPAPMRTDTLAFAPHADSIQVLDGKVYLSIAESWCRQKSWQLDAEARDILAALCEFHSRIQGKRGEIDVTLRSLECLKSATQQIALAQLPEDPNAPTFEDLLRGRVRGDKIRDIRFPRANGKKITLRESLEWTLWIASKDDPQRVLLEGILSQVEKEFGL
jgi:hypothetical protein